jgi:6-phosphogluconate dehydrogenase (decarboxylating)
MRTGHRCVVFDQNPATIAALVKEGATGGADLNRFVAQLEKPRAVWVMLLSAALYARFRSREKENFSDKLLSAMRHEFGGHVEPKAAG